MKDNIPKLPIKIEKTKASCGHEVDFPIYETDKYQEKRKKKLGSRPCKDCKARQHKELLEKQRLDAIQKRKDRLTKKRLPDMSHYNIWYNESAEMWFGYLDIFPEKGNKTNKLRFQGEATSVPKLFGGLDNQWRNWLDGSLAFGSGKKC